MDEKLSILPYYFAIFFLFKNNEKSAQNGRKVKAIALLFLHFLPLFKILKNRLKMDEKLSL
jgi:hypothetical protein